MGANERAIERLYQSHYMQFRNALATVTGSYASARDATQEAFGRALENAGQLRNTNAVRSWVWAIALRLAMEQRSDQVDMVEPELDPQLAEALAQLSPRRRLIVFLRYVGRLSHSEIAELCGVTEGTVERVLAEAREALEAQLVAEVER